MTDVSNKEKQLYIWNFMHVQNTVQSFMVSLPHKKTRPVKNDIICVREAQSWAESRQIAAKFPLINENAVSQKSHPYWKGPQGDQFDSGIPKCSLAWQCTADAAGENKSDVDGEAWLWLCDGNDSQLKVLDFPHWLNWKCGDHKQTGITEIMWPNRGNPQTAVCVIFLRLRSPLGCRQRPIRFGCLPSWRRGSRSVLSVSKDQQGPDVSHTHRHCLQPGLIARESDAPKSTLNFPGPRKQLWFHLFGTFAPIIKKMLTIAVVRD